MLLFTVTLWSPINTKSSFAIGADTVLQLSNQARSEHSIQALTPNTTLMSAAQAKAEDMAANHYFAHFSPSGKTPWDFFKEAGYSYRVAGENLAITNENEQAVINGWLNSPTHRENLLSNQYGDIGIGIARFGDYQGNKNTTVIVALYGSSIPKLAVTGTEPTNPAGTVAVLKPALIGSKLYIATAVAIALIFAGAALEIRHIRRHQVSL